jgi:hypothetical protein
MFILGQAHQSHPDKHVLGSAIGGGWPLSQAQTWVANKSSAQPGSPCARRQTPEGGRPWLGLTRPGPVRLARPAAATLTNTPILILSSSRRTRCGDAFRNYNASWTQSWRMSRTLKKRLRSRKGLHQRNKFGWRKINVHLRKTNHYPRHQLINQWPLHLRHGRKI